MICKVKLPDKVNCKDVIITIGIVPRTPGTLLIFTDPKDWECYAERMHWLPLTNAKARAAKRLTLNMAAELEVIDGQYILLPEELLEYVARDKEGDIVVHDYVEYYEKKLGLEPPTKEYQRFIVVVE